MWIPDACYTRLSSCNTWRWGRPVTCILLWHQYLCSHCTPMNSPLAKSYSRLVYTPQTRTVYFHSPFSGGNIKLSALWAQLCVVHIARILYSTNSAKACNRGDIHSLHILSVQASPLTVIICGSGSFERILWARLVLIACPHPLITSKRALCSLNFSGGGSGGILAVEYSKQWECKAGYAI